MNLHTFVPFLACAPTHMNTTKLQWGILGTGIIATTFAAAWPGRGRASGGRREPDAGVGRSVRRRSWASTGGTRITRRCWPTRTVQAVYIATPHPMHAEWAIKAAEAGKHILCEKPIGMNHAEAMAIVDAARGERRVPDGSVHVPLPSADGEARRADPREGDRRRAGDPGDVRLHTPPFDPRAGCSSNALAGGGILDVGCYCPSMARLIAGAATGQRFRRADRRESARPPREHGRRRIRGRRR